jgi:predicted nucleic acid-binding Zn ribbon protein
MAGGRWAVERERCRLEPDEAPRRVADAVPLADALKIALRRHPIGVAAGRDLIAQVWGEVAGAGIAAHARPGRFESSHLTVYVDNSVWLSELARSGKTRLLANLRERLGPDVVRTLSFQIDPDARTSSRSATCASR